MSGSSNELSPAGLAVSEGADGGASDAAVVGAARSATLRAGVEVSGVGVGSVIGLSVGFLEPCRRLGLHGHELVGREPLDVGQVFQPDIARALVEQAPRG